MSSKWSLQAEDDTIAKMAFSIWFGKNIPVAIYEPKELNGFMPVDILRFDSSIDTEKIKDSMKSITKES